MKFLKMTKLIAFTFALALGSFSQAQSHDHHSHHHDAIKSAPLVPGHSIFHLESTWKNQKGESVKISELSKKPRLVVMLFTQCQTACPVIVEDLRSLVSSLTPAQRSNLVVSIFSMDPTRDTPQKLSEFAKKRRLPKDWELYTSDPATVAEFAAVLGVRYKKLDNGDFLHSNSVYFLDSQGVILAKKDGLKTPNEEFLKQIKATKALL